MPLRRVERRTESGGRKVFIERVEEPDPDGRWAPLEEIVTETTRRETRRTRNVTCFGTTRSANQDCTKRLRPIGDEAQREYSYRNHVGR